jgi:GNAT superfamily N-acetyltransferase
MNVHINYREGNIDDLLQLRELGLKSYKEYSKILSPDNWAKFEHSLNNAGELAILISKSTVFICETLEKEIVGAVFFIPSGNPTELFLNEWCCVRRLSVHPNYRGRGIAKKLTELSISHAKEIKEKTLALHTSEFMDAARHIYEELGFVKVRQVDGLFGKRYWIYKYILEV